MEKFTWNDLAAAIAQLPAEEREKRACISIDDESYFRNVHSLQTIAGDIYVNVDDEEDCGPMEELKKAHPQDFDEFEFRLATTKGTPYLSDGFR